MKPTTKNLTWIICLSFLFGSCKKDEVRIEKYSSMLTAHPWHVVSEIETWNVIQTRDTYATWSACKKDNYYVFRNDRNVELNPGPTWCSAADSLAYFTYWALDDSDPLYMHLRFDGSSYKIISLTVDKMILSVKRLDYNGEPITTTTTYNP